MTEFSLIELEFLKESLWRFRHEVNADWPDYKRGSEMLGDLLKGCEDKINLLIEEHRALEKRQF